MCMRFFLGLFFLCCLTDQVSAQAYVYTVKADSTKLTGCDSNELIVENHTQAVPGFLFNTGNGRTQFRRGLLNLGGGLYGIGADTLNLSNNWLQGGNSFGTTGILGTLDANHLDFYTNGTGRMRLTNSGHLLIGTATDNGNPFQVNGGASFSGDVNIGTATITNGGSLIGTNAILFNHVISQFHSYQGNDVYVGKLDNVLYGYATRLNSSTTTDPATGNMTIDIAYPPNELSDDTIGITYPGGLMDFYFWDNGVPQSVSVMLYSQYRGTWYGPYSTNTNLSTNGAGFFQVSIPNAFNFINEVKITITTASGGWINLQDLDYVLSVDNEGLANAYPYVGKIYDERLYNSLYFRYQGVDRSKISPFSNYFLSPLYLGANGDNGTGNALQVTGNMNATGAVGIGVTTPTAQLHTTGTVRFTGLSNDNTQTNVLVSDANGYVYYRNASSFAWGGTSGSGRDVAFEKVRLKQADWPDYVFATGYPLPSLTELRAYVKKNDHLPGIPSATEVVKDGLDVGKTEAALLKKIEELTLYLMKEDQQVQELTREVKKLKKSKEMVTRTTN